MYSTQKGTDMDLKRHGFKEKDNAAELPDDVNKYRNSQSQIGSKLEANMTFNINRNVSWTSRFYYFTDYHRITGEFENTFNLQISRFFSTRINLHLRYDDGVAKNEDFDSYLQINELLSFGFNYKYERKYQSQWDYREDRRRYGLCQDHPTIGLLRMPCEKYVYGIREQRKDHRGSGQLWKIPYK